VQHLSPFLLSCKLTLCFNLSVKGGRHE